MITTLAQRMMEQTHIDKALIGVRGREPVNLAALRTLLTNSSYCFCITITVGLKLLSRAIAEPEY